ncbi:unnamed protein product [Owenia fusiformis]|uniref:Ricin B lectin domain-containing protein n=1 Tax=Owenia fusiformis TaxID=6347 RepID=A0A8S4NXH4_OWEFU|nr:unnamed protein product [Owenia fusiformis]
MARSQQRFAVFWSVFVLLQQFDVILALNIINMRKQQRHNVEDDTKTNQESSVFRNKKNKLKMVDTMVKNDPVIAIGSRTIEKDTIVHLVPQLAEKNHPFSENLINMDLKNSTKPTQKNRDRRAIGDEASVIHAIRNTARKMQEQDSNVTEKVMTWIHSCHSGEESRIKTFWKEQEMIYPMYLIFSSVSYYLLDCNETMEKRVEELVQLIDYDEIVSFLQDLSSEDLTFIHQAGKSNDTFEATDDVVDPEGPENAQEMAAVEIVTTNFERVQEMNNVINQLNNHDDMAQFSRAGLDEYLDDIIMEYDTVSDMLIQQGSHENSRKKRRVFTNELPKVFPEYQDSILDVKKRKLHKHPTFIDPETTHRNAKIKVARTYKEKEHAYDRTQHDLMKRNRRSTGLDREDLSFFTIQDRQSCRVLTPDDSRTGMISIILADVDYNNITDQLWYQYGNSIVHATRDLFLTSEQNSHIILDFKRLEANQQWSLQDNILTAVDDNIELVPDDIGDNVVVKSRNDSNRNGNWSFTHMKKEELTSCSEGKRNYFVIQHEERHCFTLCASDEHKPSPSLISVLPIIISSIVAIAGITMSSISLKMIESKRLARSVFVVGIFLSLFIGVGILLLPSMDNTMDTTPTDTIDLVLKHYDHENPDYCSWYEEGNYFINVGIQNVTILKELDMNRGILDKDNFYEENALTWVFDGAEILHLGVIMADYNKGMENNWNRNVTNETDPWKKIKIDSPTFFEDITCLYVLASSASAQTMAPKCEEFPWLFTNDLSYNQLWYYGENNKMTNLVPGSSVQNLSENGMRPIELTDVQIKCRSELFFIQNKDLPCKVLTFESDDFNGPAKITFSTFNVDKLADQLWLLRDGNLIHYRSGGQLTVLEGSTSVTLTEFGDEWTRHDNQTIVSPSRKCQLRVSIGSDNSTKKPRVECNDSELSSALWEMVPFDSDYLSKLVCTYFIQNQLVPCESLTLDKSKMEVRMSPVLVDTLESQLWYTLNDTIYHLETGLTLGIRQDGTTKNKLDVIDLESENRSTLTWKYVNSSLMNKETGGYLTVDTNTGSVHLKQPEGGKSEDWVFLESQSALNKPEQLSCTSSNTKEYFFIKLSSRPCDLLTAGQKLESPTFVPFDEERSTLQLWYWDFGHLINLETGLSLQINTKDEQRGSHFDVILDDTFAYRRSQLFSRKYESILALDSACTLGSEPLDTTSKLVCSNQLTTENSKWQFLAHEQALDDIAELVCVYFIRNNHKYCEFLTGYDEGQSLKARPLLHELVDGQLFFWKENNLVHLKTGLRLTTSGNTVTLQESDDTSGQMLELIDDRLVSNVGDTSNYLSVDIHQDGIVKAMSKYREASRNTQGSWSLFEMKKVFNDLTVTHCPFHTHPRPKRFFIKHSSKPCLVLATSEIGQPPVFKVFDKDNIQKQLWTFENQHIINEESGLALMLDNERIRSNRVAIMWHVYEYSRLQKWSGLANGNFSIDDFGTSYYLSPFDEAEVPTVIGSTNRPTVQGQWQVIEMDDDFNFHDKITCHFFLKNPLIPCELLTGINGRVVVRPVQEALVTHQLWSLDGKRIRNVGSGLYLTGYGKNVYLTDRKYHYLQNWRYSSRQLIHEYSKTVVSIETGTGDITLNRLLSSYDPDVTARQQWIKVDKQVGVQNPEQLECQTRENGELYVIRSEHGDCPVLTDIGNYAGVRTVESPSEANIWIRQGYHIVNAKSKRALSVKYGRHMVYMENMVSHHQTRQHWTWGNNKILSGLEHSSNMVRYLTYSSNYIQVANFKGTDEQKWAWNTLEAVQEDEKLLRCSRCYNKGEETAAEVIGYIPIFGWLYNLFRSVTYAIKDCPKVALGAFRDFALDIIIDIAVALSMGAVSAIAYGVKTAVKVGLKAGIKAGLKAGVKAGFKAAKSMIKLSIKAAKSGFKSLLKNGLTKTLKLKLNMVMSTTKMTLKTGVKALKKAPALLKSITQRALRGSKKALSKTVSRLKSAMKKTKWSKSNLKAMPSILQNKLKHLPKKIKLRFQNFGHSIMKSLKRVGNKISKKAENAINKADDIKRTKKTIRCRRSPKLLCKPQHTPFRIPDTLQLRKPNEQVKKYLNDLKDNLPKGQNDNFNQRAALGLTTKNGKDFVEFRVVLVLMATSMNCQLTTKKYSTFQSLTPVCDDIIAHMQETIKMKARETDQLKAIMHREHQELAKLKELIQRENQEINELKENAYRENQNTVELNKIVMELSTNFTRLQSQRTAGAKGDQGAAGPKGDQGVTGPKGDQGVTGPKGDQGVTGPKGDQGVTGLKGDQGVTGPKGDQGVTGPKGDQGVTGAKGDSGSHGSKGDRGSQGPKGARGSNGSKGDRGSEGPKGDRGSQGPKGDRGSQGPKGARGSNGSKGDRGSQGPKGARGNNGSKGDRGSEGPKGDRGSKGPEGDHETIGETGEKYE